MGAITDNKIALGTSVQAGARWLLKRVLNSFNAPPETTPTAETTPEVAEQPTTPKATTTPEQATNLLSLAQDTRQEAHTNCRWDPDIAHQLWQRSEELLREASAAYEANDWDRAKHYAQDVIDIIVHKRQQALNREHPDAPTPSSVELAVERLSDPHRHGGGRCRLFGYRELANLLECSAAQKLKPVRLLVLGKNTLIEALFSALAKHPVRTKEGTGDQAAALFRLGISRELTAYIVGIALDDLSRKSEWAPLIGKFPACVVHIDHPVTPSETEVKALHAALMHTTHRHILIASPNTPVDNAQKRWPFEISQIDCSKIDRNSSPAYLARLLKESLQTPPSA